MAYTLNTAIGQIKVSREATPFFGRTLHTAQVEGQEVTILWGKDSVMAADRLLTEAEAISYQWRDITA